MYIHVLPLIILLNGSDGESVIFVVLSSGGGLQTRMGHGAVQETVGRRKGSQGREKLVLQPICCGIFRSTQRHQKLGIKTIGTDLIAQTTCGRLLYMNI